jgi:beta-lactam-binding protein with PASTA domain
MDGRVISQAPSAGTQILASDQVTIYVGVYTPPEEPEVPEEPEDPDAPKRKAVRP